MYRSYGLGLPPQTAFCNKYKSKSKVLHLISQLIVDKEYFSTSSADIELTHVQSFWHLLVSCGYFCQLCLSYFSDCPTIEIYGSTIYHWVLPIRNSFTTRGQYIQCGHKHIHPSGPQEIPFKSKPCQVSFLMNHAIFNIPHLIFVTVTTAVHWRSPFKNCCQV